MMNEKTRYQLLVQAYIIRVIISRFSEMHPMDETCDC